MPEDSTYQKPDQNDREIAPSPDNVCVCFHVPLNKIVKFIRLEQPKVPSQLSNCYGAGTGCGWCIPFLEKLFEEMEKHPEMEPNIGLSTDRYLAMRKEYLKKINAKRIVELEDELSAFEDRIEEE